VQNLKRYAAGGVLESKVCDDPIVVGEQAFFPGDQLRMQGLERNARFGRHLGNVLGNGQCIMASRGKDSPVPCHRIDANRFFDLFAASESAMPRL
jgi:hypothetical protein